MTYEELLSITDSGIEIWKPIVGYDFNYQVSNLGNVKQIINNQKTRNSEEIILHKYKASKGYPYVRLFKSSKARTTYIHRLVAIAFIPNPYNKPEVDHINTNTEDCRIRNLRWVTHKENANNELTRQHCKDNVYTKEVADRSLKIRKATNGLSAPKTVYQYTKNGEFVKEYFSMEEAERQTGASHICEVLDDNTVSAGGFIWATSLTDNFKYEKRISKRLKPILQYDLNGRLLAEWPSVSEAARQLKTSTSSICKSINCSSPKKYIFRYKEGV